jgi:hypothetical protein
MRSIQLSRVLLGRESDRDRSIPCYLGFDYRQHVDEEHSNEDKAHVIAGLELRVIALLETLRDRLLADWEQPELAVR